MEDKKAKFLKDFQDMPKPTTPKEAFPLFVSFLKRAKEEQITFTKDEITFLCEKITKDLSAKDKEVLNTIRTMFQI